VHARGVSSSSGNSVCAKGRSSAEGLSARPWPGLASPRLTFTGRFRADKAPDVLVEALAPLDAPPPAYLVGDGPARQALIQLVGARGLRRVVRLPGWSYQASRYVSGAEFLSWQLTADADAGQQRLPAGPFCPVTAYLVRGSFVAASGQMSWCRSYARFARRTA
jgi:hypothetical protein